MNGPLEEGASPEPGPFAPGPTPTYDFLTVYEEVFPFVWRIARRMGVDDASIDDVCQDVFVVVHKRLPDFEGRSSLRSWVYGILQNVVSSHRRTKRRRDPPRGELDPEAIVDGAPGPQDVASGAEAARIAEAMLAQIDEDKRTMLVLVDLEGMSVPEAAEATETKLNTAYARLRTARIEFAAAVARFQAKERGGRS